MSKWEIAGCVAVLGSMFLLFSAPNTLEIAQAHQANEAQPTIASANGSATFEVGSCLTFSEDHLVRFTMIGTTWEVKVNSDGSYTSCRIY